ETRPRDRLGAGRARADRRGAETSATLMHIFLSMNLPPGSSRRKEAHSNAECGMPNVEWSRFMVFHCASKVWRGLLCMNHPHQVEILPAPAHARGLSWRRDSTQRRGGAGTQRIETATDGPLALASRRRGVSALVPRVRHSRELETLGLLTPHPGPLPVEG